MSNVNVRTMRLEDYEQVYDLWTNIHGFAMRSIDDSYDGVKRFLQRNPSTSVVAEWDNKIVGAVLCGHDGRQASFYHVGVLEAYRKHGIGKAMVTFAMRALQEEHINKISLVAFTKNELGNHFWHKEGWKLREDLNCYDFILNEENITRFNQ